MHSSHIGRIGLGLFGALAIAACSSAPQAQGPQPAIARQNGGELSPVERARADSARLPYTAADIHFMTGMISHHSQAIEMSRMAETHGASESVRTLASRIINAQRDEITTMGQWLRNRNQPVPTPGSTLHPTSDMGHDMAGMPGMSDHAMMPGMLTTAQMQQLDSARGKEFDKLFLTGMIQHHRGAVAMVKELFGTTGAGQDEAVFKFANDVNVDQTTEIARMQRMLAAITLGIQVP